MKSQVRHFLRAASDFVLLGILIAAAHLNCAAAPSNASVQEISGTYLNATNDMGPWIWAGEVHNDQTCQLWKTFEIPDSSSVTNAHLFMTADDEFTLYLDGRELGHGVDWREIFTFDLTPLLTTGKHVLAVRAYNAFFSAGVIFKLDVRLTDGRMIQVKSDESWRVVPNSVKRWETKMQPAADWPFATIQAKAGADPWTPWPVNIVGMPTLQPIRLAFWQMAWFQITVLTLFSLLILVSLRLVAQLALHRKERLLLQQERTRIAREIHDDVGSKMTQLVLHGEVAQRDLPEGSTTQLQLAEICEESRSVLASMDEILWAVNPQRDTLRDFASYVCKYAEEFLRVTQIQCLFEVSPEMPTVEFNLAHRRSLLMAIKETLNNAVKHSGATELHLQIRWEDQMLHVVVQDNGKGFDPKTVRPDRHGMANLKQRMSELGGSCRVVSEPGKGCRVEFNILLKRPRRNPWTFLSALCGTRSENLLQASKPHNFHTHEDR